MPSVPTDSIPVCLSSPKIFLGWEAITRLVENIKWQWSRQENYEGYQPERIIALGRGAMIPARLLAGDNTTILYMGIRSYKEEEQGELGVYQYPPTFKVNEATLIVDDLWDSGETFRYAKKRWPLAKTAALLAKVPTDETCLDYVGLSLPTASWVVFPWE